MGVTKKRFSEGEDFFVCYLAYSSKPYSGEYATLERILYMISVQNIVEHSGDHASYALEHKIYILNNTRSRVLGNDFIVITSRGQLQLGLELGLELGLGLGSGLGLGLGPSPPRQTLTTQRDTP